MKTLLFFGNCQLYAIKLKLHLDVSNYNCYHHECHTTNINITDFTDQINKTDIIISQNISDNYRGGDYLNLNYILQTAKDKLIIIVPSCYFEFYYPDLKYLTHNSTTLHDPSPYHYQFMIDNFKNNGSIENYITNYVNNIELIGSEKLLEKATNSINELTKRTNTLKDKIVDMSNVYTICISNFIENNFKEKLLFYSMNHPTKYVIEFICEEIVNIVQIPNTINYGTNILDNTKCILYKCIQPLVHFDINKETMKTCEHTDIFSIVESYHKIYSQLYSKN
jgi:hypothetical protein